MAQKKDFILEQQATHSYVVVFVNSDNTERALDQDAAGTTVNRKYQLDCRLNVTSADHLFRLFGDTTQSTGMDIVLGSSNPSATTPVNDQLTISFSHDLTAALDFDKGYYDLIMYSPDKSYVEILMSGTITLNKTITRLV